MSSSVHIAPYGTWPGSVTPEILGAGNVALSQVRICGPDTYWVERRADQGGRQALLCRAADGITREVLPLTPDAQLVDVRTRVHEYGGKAYAATASMIVLSHAGDGRMYRFSLFDKSEGLVALTPVANKRYGDMTIDVERGVVYAVCEDHTVAGQVDNYLVAVPLDGSAARDAAKVSKVFGGTDFVTAPAISPCGRFLAWVSWDHPAMPWEASRLHVAMIGDSGALLDPYVLVDQPGVGVAQPRWTFAGDLIHVDTSNGWWNLYRTEGFAAVAGQNVAWDEALRTRALHPSEKEFSGPQWVLGIHTYDIYDDDHLLCSWAVSGQWHLGTVRLDNGQLEEWDIGWQPAGNVAVSDGRVVLLADSPNYTLAVVELHATRVEVLRRSSFLRIPEGFVSPMIPMAWDGPGGKVYGFFHPPRSDTHAAPEGHLPPLLLWVHGGPTAAAEAGFDLRHQFWTERGFACLDVNYRGSSGYGRQFQQALQGQWGVADVEDCISGAEYLIAQGLVDPARIAIRGSSAGGYTVLRALTTSHVFTAGISLYGIADLRMLAHDTHKFEQEYLRGLLGADSDDPVWADRSPINHLDSLHTPLLLLQGDQDMVVPLNQAEAMAQAADAAGVPNALVVLAGEGHGFRSAAAVQRAAKAELSFLAQVWGFTPADDLEPVKINNL